MGSGCRGGSNLALLCRLVLSQDDKLAREEAEKAVEKEFEELFSDAESLEVTDIGQGLQSFSATFDLTKTPGETN